MKWNRKPNLILSVLFAFTLSGCSKSPNTPTSSTSRSYTPTAEVRSAVEKLTGDDPLPSWKDGPAKQAVTNFVKTITDKASTQFVEPEDRIATFDQDGTLWVEHPMYSQLVFSSERYSALAPQHPEWSNKALFHGKLINDAEAMSKYSGDEFDAIDQATQVVMPVDEFDALAKNWMATAKHPRFDKPYTELVYEPMLEVMQYLRANGYRTYIVTGGGQIFVRTYSQQVYGVPPEQVIGSALKTEYQYDKGGEPILLRTKTILLNNNNAGKAEDIYLFISNAHTLRLATRPATSRCSSTLRGAAEPHWRCWYYITTRSGNMPMARRKDCLILISANLLRHCMTKPRARVGQSSA
jgi:haloacid dehalogenase-like hydrolase